MVFMPDGDPVCLKQCRCHTVAGFQYAVKCTIVNHAAAAGRTVGFQDHMCDIALLQMLQCPQCALFKGISDIFAVTAGNPGGTRSDITTLTTGDFRRGAGHRQTSEDFRAYRNRHSAVLQRFQRGI